MTTTTEAPQVVPGSTAHSDGAGAFVPVQTRLSRMDALNEYIQHVGSALFAVPPGVRDKDDWWGRTLFSKEA